MGVNDIKLESEAKEDKVQAGVDEKTGIKTDDQPSSSSLKDVPFNTVKRKKYLKKNKHLPCKFCVGDPPLTFRNASQLRDGNL